MDDQHVDDVVLERVGEGEGDGVALIGRRDDDIRPVRHGDVGLWRIRRLVDREDRVVDDGFIGRGRAPVELVRLTGRDVRVRPDHGHRRVVAGEALTDRERRRDRATLGVEVEMVIGQGHARERNVARVLDLDPVVDGLAGLEALALRPQIRVGIAAHPLVDPQPRPDDAAINPQVADSIGRDRRAGAIGKDGIDPAVSIGRCGKRPLADGADSTSRKVGEHGRRRGRRGIRGGERRCHERARRAAIGLDLEVGAVRLWKQPVARNDAHVDTERPGRIGGDRAVCARARGPQRERERQCGEDDVSTRWHGRCLRSGGCRVYDAGSGGRSSCAATQRETGTLRNE